MARTFTYTPEEVAEKADLYIAQCAKDGVSPLLKEFALIMNVHIDTLTDWQKTKEYSDPIKRIKDLGEIALVRKVEDGARPIGAMFLLKANHGYVEKQHVEHSGTLNISSILDGLDKPQLDDGNTFDGELLT